MRQPSSLSQSIPVIHFWSPLQPKMGREEMKELTKGGEKKKNGRKAGNHQQAATTSSDNDNFFFLSLHVSVLAAYFFSSGGEMVAVLYILYIYIYMYIGKWEREGKRPARVNTFWHWWQKKQRGEREREKRGPLFFFPSFFSSCPKACRHYI